MLTPLSPKGLMLAPTEELQSAMEKNLLDIRAWKDRQDLLWSEKRQCKRIERHDLTYVTPKQKSTYVVMRDLFISVQCVSLPCPFSFLPRSSLLRDPCMFRGGWAPYHPGQADDPSLDDQRSCDCWGGLVSNGLSLLWGCSAGNTAGGCTTSLKNKPDHEAKQQQAGSKTRNGALQTLHP